MSLEFNFIIIGILIYIIKKDGKIKINAVFF